MTACQSILSVQPLSTTDNSPKQQIRQLSTPLPTPDRKEEIISQIKQIASTYNQFIQDEKKTGNFAVTSLGDGTDGFIFTKESEVKVFKEDVLVHQKIEDLNGQYYRIYKEEKGPAPTTTVSSQKDLQVRLSKELNELQIWYSNELMYGAIVKLYSPSDMNYISLLIGESYAIEKEKEENIIALNHILNMPPFDLINLDIKKIQSIEPGEVTYIDNSEVPFYRSDIKLATYETATRSYTLYTNSHEIIEIIPKIIPQTADLTPVASLAGCRTNRCFAKINGHSKQNWPVILEKRT